MTDVDELVEKLAQPDGRKAVEVGRFTVARERGAELAMKYRLPDPYFYVLELIQAADLQGADRIDIEIEPRSVRLTFDGGAFSWEDLDRLYDTLLDGMSDGRPDAYRHLALGLSSVKALEPSRVTLLSGYAGELTRVTWRPGQSEQVERVTDTSSTGPGELQGTRLEVSFGDAPPREVLERQGEPRPEAALARERCCYAESSVYINGELVSAGLALHGWATLDELSAADGVRGVVGVTPDASSPTEIRVVMAGVWIATKTPPELPPGFVAVITAPAIRRDLSLADVVENEAWQRVTEVVSAAATKARKQRRLDELRQEAAQATLRPPLVEKLDAQSRRVRNGWLLFSAVVLGFWLVMGGLLWLAYGLSAGTNTFIYGNIVSFFLGALAMDFFQTGAATSRCRDWARFLELPAGTTARDAEATAEDLRGSYSSKELRAKLLEAMREGFRRR